MPTLTAPELYCLVPHTLPQEVLATLRAHFADLGARVIVDRRQGRPGFGFSHQRSLHLPREMPPLPRAARAHAAHLQFFQRMPSAGLTFADTPLIDVVHAAQEGDGVAASELVWRLNVRVLHRLERRNGQVIPIEPALGRMLDRLDEFTGRDESDFLAWLDRVVDQL